MADDEAEDQAEPAKRTFTSRVGGTVEGRSPGFLLGALALGMVISLLAGLAIGITIGNDDNSSAAKPTPTTRSKPTRTTKPGNSAGIVKTPFTGVVANVRPKVLVLSRLNRRLRMLLVPRTRVEVTSAATAADIKAGSHVVVVLKANPSTTTTGGSTTTGDDASSAPTTTAKPGDAVASASQVIIVSGTSPTRIGNEVESATADSMTFKTPSGKSVTISTVGAAIKRTIPGARVNVTVGRRVMVQALRSAPPKPKARRNGARRQLIAVYLLMLPVNPGSG